MRSRCIRNRYSTSTFSTTASRSSVVGAGGTGGSSVTGATSVTSAPSAVNTSTSLRATRLWRMSPTIATRTPSSPDDRPSAWRTV